MEAPAQRLRSILDKGSGLPTPAAVTEGPLAEFLPELDLLESFLTGIISSEGIDASSEYLVAEQFGHLRSRLERAPQSPDVDLLRKYVRDLELAYSGFSSRNSRS